MSVLAPSQISWTWRPGGRAALGLLALLVAGLFAVIVAIPPEARAFRPAIVLLVTVTLPLGWCLAAGAMAWLGLKFLEVELIDIPAVSDGTQPIYLTVELINRSRYFPALFTQARFHLRAGTLDLTTSYAYALSIEPRSRFRMSWRVVARNRGRLEIRDLRIVSQVPGAPGSVAATFSVDVPITLKPAKVDLRPLALNVLVGRRVAGGRLSFVPVAMEEYMGVREYRPGDNPRLLHRTLSLRTESHGGELYVREFEDPTIDDTCLILDTAWPTAPGLESAYHYRLEKALAFTCAFARMLVARKQRVRVYSPGQKTFPDEGISIKGEEGLDGLGRALSLLSLADNRQEILDVINRESRFGNMTVVFVSLREQGEEETNRRLPIISVTPDMAHRLIERVHYA